MAASVLFNLASWASLASAAALLAPRQDESTTANANANANVTLAPVTASAPNASSALSPSVNVSLPYGSSSTSDAATTANSVLNVGLTTSHASVLLEAITSVVSVACAADAVTVVFDSADDLASAYSAWSSHPLLVLVTNHMGDCDSEVERGFFTADSFSTDASTLTLVASAQKSSIGDIGSYLTTNFSGVPVVASSSKAKRGLGSVTYSPDPINFSTDLVLNETSLFSTDDFSASVDSGSLDISVTVGGFLTYNIITSTLVELEVYLETNTTSDLVLDFDFYVPYNGTFSHTEAIETYTVDIPGVLSFGPEISFEIGAEVSADAGVDVTLDLSSAIENGTFTLDYTGNLSYSGEWKPTFDISVSVSEEAAVAVVPFVTSTFALDFSLLGGAFNVSGGIQPSSKFPTEISLVAEQGSGSTKRTSDVSAADSTCDNGVQVDSDFDFSLYAFVSGEWNDEYLYNVTLSVLDECLSWA